MDIGFVLLRFLSHQQKRREKMQYEALDRLLNDRISSYKARLKHLVEKASTINTPGTLTEQFDNILIRMEACRLCQNHISPNHKDCSRELINLMTKRADPPEEKIYYSGSERIIMSEISRIITEAATVQKVLSTGPTSRSSPQPVTRFKKEEKHDATRPE